MLVDKIKFKEKIVPMCFFIIICSCETDNQVIKKYPIPTINVKLGSMDTLDLTNYILDNIPDYKIHGKSFHKLEDNKLIISGHKSDADIELLRLDSKYDTLNIIIRYLLMVKHQFIYENNLIENAYVSGQFNDWSNNSLPMIKNGDQFFLDIYLEPKKHEYKFVADGKYVLDNNNPKKVTNNNSGWNSIIDLSQNIQRKDHQLIKDSKKDNILTFHYIKNNRIDSPSDLLVLLNNQLLGEEYYSIKTNGKVEIDISESKDGILRVFAMDDSKNYTIENQTHIQNGSVLTHRSDSWFYSIIYNPMIDRFFDGDPTNNKKVNDPKLHPLANFMGGDIKGINLKMNQGYFDNLGINTIWLSPIQTQPESSWVEYMTPNRSFTGYHGYWPIKPRQIDKRYGTPKELKELVENAKSRGIKIVLDLVTNHVHQNHIYYRDNKEWFGKVNRKNGEMNIRLWDGATRLTTWFDSFLPSYDYVKSEEAMDQVVNDALWWMEEYDLDGFRQDAVKHVPHKFWKKLTKNIKTKNPDKVIYQIGETFGSDNLISSYVNPLELDAQFNFSIYFNVRQLFSSNNTDFIGIDKIIMENTLVYGPTHLMGNITSSHDQLRFTSYADGQISFDEDGTRRALNDPVQDVINSSSLNKLINFHAFNCSQPGIPIIYYGEEIGLMGEQDPGNRRLMKFELNENEKHVLEQFERINQSRNKFPSLSIGDQKVLISKGPIFVTLKTYYDENVLLVINNGIDEIKLDIDIPIPFKIARDINTGLIHKTDGRNLVYKSKPFSYSFFSILN